MRFKGSAIEEQCNELWNSLVVPADNAIKRALSVEPRFFQSNELTLKRNVKNIIKV
ncbi:MAG: hypothetical protein Q8M03_14880 [Legionella sp.]|nr:hypothetical protein [Legionella sp.]